MTVDAAFMHFPELTTARLRLRELRPSDAEALFAIKSDFEVTRHYSSEPHQSVNDSLTWIENRLVNYQKHDSLVWAVTLKDEDRLIGDCLFWHFDFASGCTEIGYELHPAYVRQGMMTEAASAVIAFGFEQLDLHRIEADASLENAASNRLLRKLGFTLEGTLRERHFFRGHYHDECYYGLLRDEWGGAS
ncbi:MAG TPA: GNAT family protein [Phototrophicaceae bacterium]|nr:GNAT family protein [Phototrophicaceae bacterium]